MGEPQGHGEIWGLSGAQEDVLGELGATEGRRGGREIGGPEVMWSIRGRGRWEGG